MERRDKKGLTEAEFLEVYKTKNYPKPMLTADIAILSEHKGETLILMIKRGGHPFIDMWALPGGFANMNECIEDTARRELVEETGVENAGEMVEIGLFSKPGRDPRGWVVSDAFASEVVYDDCKFEAADDAKQAMWFAVSLNDGVLELRGEVLIRTAVSEENGKVSFKPLTEEALAFDHAEVIYRTLKRLGKA